MDTKETEICGRTKEIHLIKTFIESKIQNRQPGVLYLPGPPGVGKSMSIQYVLDNIAHDISMIHINCFKESSSKLILTKLCNAFGLSKFIKCNESEMIERLSKKFTGRTSQTSLIVLDEMDQLPKSRSVDLFKQIFSWPNQDNSRLILIGVANTVNLSSRYSSITNLIGKCDQQVTTILFKPYTSQTIKRILEWCLENDQNFDQASVEPKMLDLISMRCHREGGDIRSAINNLKVTIDDDNLRKKKEKAKQQSEHLLPTPPSTPPTSPCKERTNLTAFVNSVKKRKRTTLYVADDAPVPHETVLLSLYILCSGDRSKPIDFATCEKLADKAMSKLFCEAPCQSDYKGILDNLESQGSLLVRKTAKRTKLLLTADELMLKNMLESKSSLVALLNSLKGQVLAAK